MDKDAEQSKRVKDKESGVARGIDFQFVANVINFDFPPDPDSYIHRYLGLLVCPPPTPGCLCPSRQTKSVSVSIILSICLTVSLC